MIKLSRKNIFIALLSAIGMISAASAASLSTDGTVRLTQLLTHMEFREGRYQKNAGGITLIKKVDPVIHGRMTESRLDKLVQLSKQELALVDDIEAWFYID